jgi:3-oxoacyl-[acyl-carrier-protein] synthase II
VDLALAGGVSEAIHTFGIFASFASQGALGTHADPTKVSRPFDKNRNGIVVSEGGCLYSLERLEDAQARGAKIYGEVLGYHVNSDASDFVLPNAERQAECMTAALAKANLGIGDIDLVNTHSTSTSAGDLQESEALRRVFGDDHEGESQVFVNNTKSFIGHTMGAAGALELAGNLPGFDDRMVHASINVDELDPGCAHAGLVLNEPKQIPRYDTILNLSFGMLGINSAVIIGRV